MGTWWEALLCPVINHSAAPYPSQTRSTLLSWFTGGEWKSSPSSARCLPDLPDSSVLPLHWPSYKIMLQNMDVWRWVTHPGLMERLASVSVCVCERERWGEGSPMGLAVSGHLCVLGSSHTHPHAIFLASTCCWWWVSGTFWVDALMSVTATLLLNDIFYPYFG